MSATITIIATDVRDPKQFMAMELTERRRSSLGWRSFPSKTGRHPDAVLWMASKVDLGAVELPPQEDLDTGESLRSYIIDRVTIEGVVPRLKALVDTHPHATAQALIARVGGPANPERVQRVLAALETGDWPIGNDAAKEAAAFAKNLFGYGGFASLAGLGICWEYRGAFALADAELP